MLPKITRLIDACKERKRNQMYCDFEAKTSRIGIDKHSIAKMMANIEVR